MNTLSRAIVCVTLPIAVATGQSTLVVPGSYPTIQAAINAAANGDTVFVLPGTFTENLDVLGKDIVIESAAGAAETTITSAGSGATVLFSSGSTRACVLQGFTVTGGNTTGGSPTSIGGGIRVDGCEPTIRDCVVTGNVSDSYGAGVGVTGSGAGPLIERCTISGNQATGLGYSSGGGIGVNSATPGAFGTEIVGCAIADNEAATRGGGIYFAYSPGCSIDRCRITRNVTQSTSTSLAGGAGLFLALNSDVQVSNCRIWANQSNGNAGGVKWFNVAGARVVNCTIVDNTGGGGAGFINGGAFGTSAVVDFVNCIVWQNGAGPEFEFGGTGSGGATPSANVDHCVVTGGYAGTGNLSVSPQLLNTDSGNHHLAPTSPCIDAGSAAIAPLPATDMDGDARVLGAMVDIGADEFDAGAPLLYSDVATLSAAAPTPVVYSVANAPANGLFAVFFSLSGTEPGTVAFGQNVPLNPDSSTSAFVLVGVTDPAGAGSATLPALTVPPVLIGSTLSSAALTYLTAFDFTNDENVRLVP